MTPYTLFSSAKHLYHQLFPCIIDRHARNEARIAELRNWAGSNLRENQARLVKLETKSDAMDAYYMRVLGSALKQHVDSRMDSQDTKLNLLEAKTFKGFQDCQRESNETRQAVERTNHTLVALEARIASLVRQLRNLGETN